MAEDNTEAARAELSRISNTLEQFEEYSKQVAAQIDIIRAYLNELKAARQTIANLKEEKNTEDTLIPLGAGVAIKAKVLEPGTIYYQVGAGVTVTKTTENAIKGLEERISEGERENSALSEQLMAIYQQMKSLEQRGQQLLQQFQGPPKATYDPNLPGL